MGAVDCRRFVLTLMCVQPDLNRCRMCKVLWAVEGRPSATKAFKVALQSTRASWLGSGEELGNLCVGCQGCVERSGGLEHPNLPLSALSGVQLAPTSSKASGRCMLRRSPSRSPNPNPNMLWHRSLPSLPEAVDKVRQGVVHRNRKTRHIVLATFS
jgi:hypothetical protein